MKKALILISSILIAFILKQIFEERSYPYISLIAWLWLAIPLILYFIKKRKSKNGRGLHRSEIWNELNDSESDSSD